MGDIETTEADKREAVEIARLLGAGAGIFDIGFGTRVGQTAERIARIRADAVKAERERVATRANRWVEYNRNPDTTLPFDGEDLELYLLSDDQEDHRG